MEITGGPAFKLQNSDGTFLRSSGALGFATTTDFYAASVFELLQGNLIVSDTVTLTNSIPQVNCVMYDPSNKIGVISKPVSKLGTGTGAITSSNTYTISPGVTLGFDGSNFTTSGSPLAVIPASLPDTKNYAVYSIPTLANIKFANPGVYAWTAIPSNCKPSNAKKNTYIGVGVAGGVIVLAAVIALVVWSLRKPGPQKNI
jgi:hypothetical protein